MTEYEAGRELDALVAEKVMGYVWRRAEATGRRCIYRPDKIPAWMSAAADGTEALVSDWDDHFWTPQFSTEIAAAWTVVQQLRPRFWTKLSVGLSIDTGTNLTECAMGLYATADEPSRQLAYVRDAAAPLAICRAALVAVADAGLPL